MHTAKSVSSDMEFYHKPVLLEEVLEGLNLKDGGLYYDATVGGGGHSFAILSSNPTLSLVATDKDEEAIQAANERLAPFQGRYKLFHTDYKNWAEVLPEEKLDGFLIDLGISSHQIDDPERGFAYRADDAPLDMRMDRRSPLTAEDVVNGYPEEKIKKLLKEYGEEPFAPAIAKAIVREREIQPVTTCGQLRQIVEKSLPAKLRSPACARQTFQAIRIEVNGELTGLADCVKGLLGRLKKGGRACVITFHSLEDRIVKQVFRELSQGCTCPKYFPVCTCGKRKEIEEIARKPIVASLEEQEENPRSKSAKLRIAEKITE